MKSSYREGLVAALAAVESVRAQLVEDYWTAEEVGADMAATAIQALIDDDTPLT